MKKNNNKKKQHPKTKFIGKSPKRKAQKKRILGGCSMTNESSPPPPPSSTNQILFCFPPRKGKKKKNTTPKHQHQYITPFPSLLFVFQENSNRKNTPTKYFWEINCWLSGKGRNGVNGKRGLGERFVFYGWYYSSWSQFLRFLLAISFAPCSTTTAPPNPFCSCCYCFVS